MMFWRRVSDTDRQSSNAFRAVPTARSTSSAPANATSAAWRPVAGLNTGPVRSGSPSQGFPPIQWVMVFIALVLVP